MNEEIINLEFEHYTKLYWKEIKPNSKEDLEYREKIKTLKEKYRESELLTKKLQKDENSIC